MWQYDERSAARRLNDDGQELGVDRTERRVPTALRHPNVVVALVPLDGRSVHMAEFGTAHDAKRHVGGRGGFCGAIRLYMAIVGGEVVPELQFLISYEREDTFEEQN